MKLLLLCLGVRDCLDKFITSYCGRYLGEGEVEEVVDDEDEASNGGKGAWGVRGKRQGNDKHDKDY